MERNKIYFSSFKPKRSYQAHGYALAFSITVKNSSIQKPKGYAVDDVKKITTKYISDKATKLTNTTQKNPNIIVIMNEAFSDLNLVGNLETNDDYMPFFHGLSENTIKGTLHTSVFGGHTANTEFEFLTGSTIRFMPLNAVPYRTMIRSKQPSLAWNLRDQGYTGDIAFHPGTRTSYSRDVAYPNLGFSKHIAVEDVNDFAKIRAYISDDADYMLIRDEYKKSKEKNDAPFFMFNVTIQNHGGYWKSEGVVNPSDIYITNSEQQNEEAEQYINLMKLSDTALENFISYFKVKDDPTIVVLFGDHQPGLEVSFFESLFHKPDNKLSYAEREKKYNVPFMIWANYDIEEEVDVHISANYLHSYLLMKTGGRMTGYEKYLMDLYKKIPVLNSICYMDNDGNLYDRNAQTKLKNKIEEYEKVQYNALFDKQNRVNDFFYLKK